MVGRCYAIGERKNYCCGKYDRYSLTEIHKDTDTGRVMETADDLSVRMDYYPLQSESFFGETGTCSRVLNMFCRCECI
jgi:hypothetical protein